MDRGELERLVDAEGAHYEREYSRDFEEQGRPRKKSKKRSFLENLMEGGGS